uniref:Lymphatic vessel endothelial hyaluronic receptor 1b n=1 Tax=Sinocyclocheilus rhinocerous TaxID=307959 RepID=A0A673IQ83_9TELE
MQFLIVCESILMHFIKTIFCWLLLVPTNDGITGVLLVQTKNNVCSFNATTAKEACEAIKMRIAKRAEVETANKNGFQTCRFGWVEEQIAVIPRIEKSEKCGKNKLGVSFWRADISKMFDVYCFKPAGNYISSQNICRHFHRATVLAGSSRCSLVSQNLLHAYSSLTSVLCFSKRGQRFPSWTRMRPKEIIETEMWKQISERNCMPEQTSKDNNNSKCSIILQMEQDPDSP